MVPVLPGAAKEASEDGARAFVGYYWELVNYAQATGDVRRLRRVSGPTCDVCSGFVVEIRNLYARGGHIVGGANRSTVTKVVDLHLDSGNYGLRIEQEVSHEAQSIFDGAGVQDQRAAGVDRFTAFVLWIGEHWRLDVMELQ